MAVYEFYSIIENSKEDNCYIVNFPYTWGCFTYGDTLLEAVEMGRGSIDTYANLYGRWWRWHSSCFSCRKANWTIT